MKTLQLTLFAIMAICLAACSDNKAADEITSKMTEEFHKFSDIIKDVNDVASAKAVSSKLAQAGSDLNVVFKKHKGAKITKAKKEAMDSEIESQLKGVGQAIEAKIKTLSANDPAAAQELRNGFMKLVANMTADLK